MAVWNKRPRCRLSYRWGRVHSIYTVYKKYKSGANLNFKSIVTSRDLANIQNVLLLDEHQKSLSFSIDIQYIRKHIHTYIHICVTDYSCFAQILTQRSGSLLLWSWYHLTIIFFFHSKGTLSVQIKRTAGYSLPAYMCSVVHTGSPCIITTYKAVIRTDWLVLSFLPSQK